jgi:Fe-S cluster biogenesis protein NfuA
MSAEIEKALDLIRPGLQADGGNVELVEVTEDGIVKEKVPSVTAVVAV